MGAWEEMSKEERKINCIIDLMNTLRLLCEIDEHSQTECSIDIKQNSIMVYYPEVLFDIADKLERVPEIYKDEGHTATSLTHIMQIWYRGVKIYCFMDEKTAKQFEEKTNELVSSLIFDDTEEDEGDGDDDN